VATGPSKLWSESDDVPHLRVRAALVGVLLLVAVLLRMATIPHAHFTGDESLFWATSLDVARGHAFPVYGPSATGSALRHPGPMFFYLMALPQLLGSSPQLGAGFVALLHGLGLYFLCRIVRETLGEPYDLWALVLGVFTPWDVLYADRIWLSNVAPVVGTAAMFCAVRSRRGGFWPAWTTFLLVVLPQFHLSAPLVWVAVAVLWRLERPPLRGRLLAAGFLLGVVTYVPTLVHEIRFDFPNFRAVWASDGVAGGGSGSFFDVVAGVLGTALSSGTADIGYHVARGYWFGFDYARYYASPASLWRSWAQPGFIWGLATAGSVGVAVAGWVSAAVSLSWPVSSPDLSDLARRGRPLLWALGSALLVAVVLLGVSGKRFFPHYINVLMPLWVIPMVYGGAPLTRMRGGRIGAAMILGVSVCAMGLAEVRYYGEVDRLNGLRSVEGLVGRLVQEPGPMRLEFSGFPNHYAFSLMARHRFGQNLDLRPQGVVRYVVHNQRVFSGLEVPLGSEVIDGVLLTRHPMP
jgi:hypothetical protein